MNPTIESRTAMGYQVMGRRYVTADVFTRQMFGGNRVAVVLDAKGLDRDSIVLLF